MGKKKKQIVKALPSKNDMGLMRKVIKRQESITRKDIADWKKARSQAEKKDAPRQTLLQNLYDEIMLDALMTSQVQVLRIGKSQAMDFDLYAGDKKNEEATERLRDSGLYEDLVEFTVMSRFYSHSLIEFDYTPTGLEVDIIPRKHVSPETGLFYPDLSTDSSIPFREVPEFGSWLVEIYPRKRDLGLLNKAVPYVLMKRFALSCWSELCEIYGIPPRVMKTNTSDEGMLNRAELMMREIGSAAYFIIDTTENFEFAQGTNTNGDVYRNLIATCDQMLSLLNLAAVIGQDTLHGNRSKEESSKGLMEAVVKSDRRLIETSFNKIFLPALSRIGFLPPNLKIEIAKEVNLEKLWKMVHEASSNYDIDPEWIRETFGIEVTGRKDRPAPVPLRGYTLGNFPDPDGTLLDLLKDRLKREVKEKEDSGEDTGLFLKAPDRSGASSGNHLTSFNDELIDRVWKGESTYWDGELFRWIAKDLLKAAKMPLSAHLKSLKPSIEYGAPDDVFTSSMELNLFHFSAAKTLSEVQELNKALRDSKNYSDFKKRAREITTTFNDKWQKTEYNTALQVAESASNYHALKASSKLFPIWVYRTVGDASVREEHAALDGVALPASDLIWKQIFPPNGWGCRCTVDNRMKEEHPEGFEEDRQKVEKFFQSKEWKKAKASGWGVNRSETAEVFTANQMYIRKFPHHAASYLGELHAPDYNLDSFSKKLNQATAEFNAFTGDHKEWYKKNKTFKDISGKIFHLPEKVFNTHTSGKYEKTRIPLLNAISEALRIPDEVWVNDYQKEFNNFNYIKFYKGKVVNVVCRVSGDQLQVSTWFEIEKAPRIKEKGRGSRKIDPRWKYRRGLLIKK
ncbi:MAG: DUF935 family protein [Tannerellaceae bacterium]|nr:DUF935 family protein [Tannerellaceae bacterium]